jgi:PPOX class probable F420-dependent enzyme
MDSKVEKLLNGKNLVFLATTMADGSPQVTPVWGNFLDSHILVNTAEGRIKHKNILRDPRVAISVVNSKNPLDMTSIRGEVVEILPDYEYKHANFLTKQYMGKENYPFKRPGEKRITLKIKPKKIFVLPELPMSND